MTRCFGAEKRDLEQTRRRLSKLCVIRGYPGGTTFARCAAQTLTGARGPRTVATRIERGWEHAHARVMRAGREAISRVAFCLIWCEREGGGRAARQPQKQRPLEYEGRDLGSESSTLSDRSYRPSNLLGSLSFPLGSV